MIVVPPRWSPLPMFDRRYGMGIAGPVAAGTHLRRVRHEAARAETARYNTRARSSRRSPSERMQFHLTRSDKSAERWACVAGHRVGPGAAHAVPDARDDCLSLIVGFPAAADQSQSARLRRRGCILREDPPARRDSGSPRDDRAARAVRPLILAQPEFVRHHARRLLSLPCRDTLLSARAPRPCPRRLHAVQQHRDVVLVDAHGHGFVKGARGNCAGLFTRVSRDGRPVVKTRRLRHRDRGDDRRRRTCSPGQFRHAGPPAAPGPPDPMRLHWRHRLSEGRRRSPSTASRQTLSKSASASSSDGDAVIAACPWRFDPAAPAASHAGSAAASRGQPRVAAAHLCSGRRISSAQCAHTVSSAEIVRARPAPTHYHDQSPRRAPAPVLARLGAFRRVLAFCRLHFVTRSVEPRRSRIGARNCDGRG